MSLAAEPGANTAEIVIRWQSVSEVDVAAFELRSSQVAAGEGLAGPAPTATPVPPRDAPPPPEQGATVAPSPPSGETPAPGDPPAAGPESPTPAVIAPSPTPAIPLSPGSPEPVVSPAVTLVPGLESPTQASDSIQVGPTIASPQRQERPTATPRPGVAPTSGGARNLLLLVGGGGICGALLLLLVVLLVWRKR